MKALDKVPGFGNLRSLMVIVDPGIAFCDVNSHLQQLLTNSPDLKHLALENCGCLRLSAMAKSCPKLKVLRLANCMGSNEDTPVAGGTFVNLNCVDKYVTLLEALFRSLLCVTRRTLHITRFVDEGTCTAFLEYCARYGQEYTLS
ncbi:hypothetical protein MRX96_006365 [Rhipicephalus microplus]